MQRWKNIRACEQCSCKFYSSSGKICAKSWYLVAKVRNVANSRFYCHLLSATSQDGSSLKFIAAIAGRQCYIQNASDRGL